MNLNRRTRERAQASVQHDLQEFPWRALFVFAICELHIQPEQFWRMSVREMRDLINGGIHKSPPPFESHPIDFAALMKCFPDEMNN